MSSKRVPLFEKNLQYCIRCCMPSTEEGTVHDEVGICRACQSSEQKMHINWKERFEALKKILEDAKAKAGNGYDCIVPISGGKDSAFQVYVLTQIFKVKPLAVTFNHNWYSETGWYNLQNVLETFNVDHIMFTPNRKLINKLAKRSVEMMGDTCWHCHSGVGAFSLNMAVKLKIPLMIFGESSAENFGRASYLKPHTYDREYYLRMSAKFLPEQMVGDGITAKDLYPFNPPSQEEWDAAGLQWLPLGDYIFWDDERQTEFMRDNFGWRETEIENCYKQYKSAECVMPGMHDFTCYLKRGFGRATVQANIDVRNGLLTREEGFGLINKIDCTRPQALDYYLGITGQSEEEFYETMRKHRLPQLKDAEMPVLPKDHENAERILPFPQQLIERLRPKAPNPHIIAETELSGPGVPPSTAESFLDTSIGRILEAYGKKEVSPVEIAKLCIARVEALEPQVLAWETFSPELLLEQARHTEQRLMQSMPLRKLEGIPVGIKDVFNTTDFPTEMGSPIWKGFTPGNDARVVHRLKETGALIPGKTVTAEFAVHTLRRTINPHDPTRNPGTSSSGSAAAIATGMIPAAMGTQTGASIIRPASFCGVYGYKPSFGLLPRTGVLKTTDSLDTLGFFATWLDDVPRLFDVLRVKGRNYPVSDAALSDPARQAAPNGRPWKVAFVKTHTWRTTPEYAKQAISQWAKRLDALPGISVEDVELPESMSEAHDLHSIIYDLPLAYYFREEHKHGELVSPIMHELIEHGLSIKPEEYQRALKRQEVLCADMEALMRSYDALICLSTAGEAPYRDERELQDPGLMWTLTHLPALSAPVFTSPAGLPFGAQLVARKYNDLLLLEFAAMLCEQGCVPEKAAPRIK